MFFSHINLTNIECEIGNVYTSKNSKWLSNMHSWHSQGVVCHDTQSRNHHLVATYKITDSNHRPYSVTSIFSWRRGKVNFRVILETIWLDPELFLVIQLAAITSHWNTSPRHRVRLLDRNATTSLASKPANCSIVTSEYLDDVSSLPSLAEPKKSPIWLEHKSLLGRARICTFWQTMILYSFMSGAIYISTHNPL